VAHDPAHVKRLFKTHATKLPLTSSARLLLIFALALNLSPVAQGKGRRRAPSLGSAAVVVDERLSVLRDAPDTSANLLQRLGRGRYVGVTGEKRSRDGLIFLRVAVTSRTSGWVQSEALARPSRAGEDARLFRLVQGSEEFDRLARARIFLEAFPRSALRPPVLLLFGEAAEAGGSRLARAGARRHAARELEAGGAPPSSYFRNYSGLDRWRRQGVVFDFDAEAKQFHYDGAAFREILRRHPRSPEATEARARLQALTAAPR
jgi:hypothetical protein